MNKFENDVKEYAIEVIANCSTVINEESHQRVLKAQIIAACCQGRMLIFEKNFNKETKRMGIIGVIMFLAGVGLATCIEWIGR